MNFYPPELVTPPLALVALLGCPGLHAKVGEFLRSQHKPPINSLGLAEPWAAARLFGERKSTLLAPSERTGILKADWFTKHRQRRPAVAVLFLEREAVSSNPNDWAVACSALEAVRSAAKARSAKVVIVIVGSNAELPEERTGALSRIGGVDKRYLIRFDINEGDPALRKLGRLLYEAAGQFYLDAARRRLSLHAERRSQTPELNARVAFKAAALAEFRADWATAVKTYQNAYSEVARVGLGPPLPLQRAFEVAAVAEQVHVKVVTLLLHQQRVQEALQQFKTHMGLFRRPPFTPPTPFAAAHWGWVSRQYAAMAELLTARADTSLLPPQKDAQPAYFFLCCAQAATERRRAASMNHEARGGRPPRPLDPPPAQGQFVGQIVVLHPPRRLTDEEFLHHLEVQEASIDQSKLALAALNTAQELCSRAAGTRGTRQAYFIGQLIAQEHLAANDPASAHRLLLLVAGIYRREQWQGPLVSALLDLRKCAAQLKLQQEYVLHSLELSALDGNLSSKDCYQFASEAIKTLTAPSSEGSEEGPKDSVTGFQLHVKPVNHPLLSCFALSAGFEPLPKEGNTAETASLAFGLALLSLLPVKLPFQKAEGARLAVKRHSKVGTALAEMKLLYSLSEGSLQSSDLKVAAGQPHTALVPKQWLQFRAALEANPGKLVAAVEVRLHISSQASVRWHLPSFGGVEMVGGATSEASVQLMSQLRPKFVPGLLDITPPSSSLHLELTGEAEPFALAGETVPVTWKLANAQAATNIKVQAGFLEGSTLPELSWTDAEGLERRSSDSGAAASEMLTPKATVLGPLTWPAGKDRLEVGVTLPHSGQLQILAAVTPREAEDAESSELAVRASLEMAVEQPFKLSANLSTMLGTISLIPPKPLAGQGIEQSVMLPVGEPCMLSAQLRVTAPTELEVAGISEEFCEGVECLGSSAHAQYWGAPVVMLKGDILTVILRVRAFSAQRLDSLGRLIVSWKRRRKDVWSKELHTSLSLPGAEFARPRMQVKVDIPGRATVGEPFQLNLRIQNLTSQLQQMTIAVGDGSGFVVAGSRHEALQVLPQQTAEHALSVVGYTPGSLALPHVRITAQRYDATVEPLARHRLLVSPAGVSRSAGAGVGRK